MDPFGGISDVMASKQGSNVGRKTEATLNGRSQRCKRLAMQTAISPLFSVAYKRKRPSPMVW